LLPTPPSTVPAYDFPVIVRVGPPKARSGLLMGKSWEGFGVRILLKWAKAHKINNVSQMDTFSITECRKMTRGFFPNFFPPHIPGF